MSEYAVDYVELWTEEVCTDRDCHWIEPKNHRHAPYPPSLTGTGHARANADPRETKD